MRIKTIGAVCAGLLAVFAAASCDTGLLDDTMFDYELQGTWVSNDPSVYDGKLEITYDTITITGYTEDQTPLLGDDTKRPFWDFTPNSSFSGYSEDGKIFIEDEGMLQEGIPYNCYTNFDGQEFLLFTFGGREEKLKKTQKKTQ